MHTNQSTRDNDVMRNSVLLQAKTPVNALAPEVWRWRATDIAEQVRLGSISCVEVLEAFHARIDAVNPRLNAIVHEDRERSIGAARRLDELRRKAPHEAGILCGVPMTIKLNVDVMGEATTNGVPSYSRRVAPADSSVVANVRRAGAIINGRTNVPPFSFRWFTEGPLYGRTLNPWSKDVTSGGSSGGAGVSVATGMCAIAHGTDIAGSIRYPAYVNGVIGLRTTSGRIPAYHPTTTQRFYGLQSMSAQGPLARTVADAHLGLRAMIGADTRDPTWANVRIENDDDAEPVKVALVDEIPNAPVCDEVKKALLQAATSLAAAGYVVERAQPPAIEECVEIWQSIVMTESRFAMIAAVDATGDPAIMQSVHNMAACGPSVDLAGYVQAIARRDEMRRKWNEFLCSYPLLLMSVSCRMPQPWGADLGTVDDMRELVAAQSPLIAVAALGLPGISVPTGMSGGLPVGVQLVAASFRELRLLCAASIVERDAETRSALDYTAN